MDIDFRGYGENVATFKADDSVEVGCFVVMKDNYEVSGAVGCEEIFGLCLGVREGYAAVQLSGYVEALPSGVIPVGVVGLLTNGKNHVMTYHIGATKHRVIYSDGKKVGFIL